jgi:hypothetical protein
MGVASTITIKDGQSTPSQKQMRSYDESGSGAGPWRNMILLSKGDFEGTDWIYAAASGGILNTTTAVTIKTAAGAGLRNYITALQITAEALTNATEIVIRDGAGGLVLWRSKIGTSGLVDGIGICFPSPLKGSTNTLLEVATLTASGAGAVYINAQGFVAS